MEVRIYGYGGNLQDERISSAYLKEFDDFKGSSKLFCGWKNVFFYGRGPVSWDSNTATIRTRNH